MSIIALMTISSSAKVYIPLVKSVPPTTGGGGDARTGIRSSSYVPLAYYEDNVIYIQYPARTVSSVIITNDSTDMAVLSRNFPEETTSVQVDISTLNYRAAYNISVNAFGNWWVGYLDFSATTTVQKTRKGFSSIIEDSYEGCNIGVYGVAGNATSGWNYGVIGMLSGENGGTGVYGSSKYDDGFNSGGRFAGLFHGDIKTTDAVYASVYNTLADSRLNMNMEPIETGSLNNLMQVSVFRYGLKQIDVVSGEESKKLGYYNDDSGILEKEHFGLSGQEIMELYPNLVSEDQNGLLSVNYVEMIPLLIHSIQELKMELDALKTNTRVSERVSEPELLYQNVPNPFSDRCIIKCSIPEYVKEASLYVYDYNGRQVQHKTIGDRGNVQVVIEGNGFEAGIYLYSLVADGKLVDTKRMIHILE